MIILYTPFDGAKVKLDSLSDACRKLKLRDGTVRNHFLKQRQAGKPEFYVFEGGKIERIRE